MFQNRPQFSLQQKVIDSYLMIGLGCIFACIAGATVLTWHESLLNYLAMLVTIPLITLICGAVYLKRNLKTDFGIEQQLQKIATTSHDVAWNIETVRSENQTAQGWNELADTLDRFRSGQSVLERLEAALSDSSEGSWQEIFDALPEILVVTNGAGSVRYANLATSVACGWDDCEPAVGRDLRELLAEIMRTSDHPQMENIVSLTPGETLEIGCTENLADGVWRIARLTNPRAQGNHTSLWQISDVTQRSLVQDARDQFVFTATHELRTPLANIRAYAETLAMAEDIDIREQKSFINTINAEASRLARFIDDLLNISQMEAGAISITRHETDLEKLLGEVAENIRSLVDSKQQEFETKLPAKLPKVWIDKDKIASAITNLLSNANKYTPEQGQIRLLVEDDETHIHFHVEDSGIGIAADELPRISEKFFRSQDQRVRDVTGSGIGLAFSAEVARLHSGRLTILSELDKGSRFTLTIPYSSRQR